MVKKNSCEMFAGGERGNTNIGRPNVPNMQVESLVQAESTERGGMHVQAYTSMDSMRVYSKHHPSVGSTPVPSVVAFDHRFSPIA